MQPQTFIFVGRSGSGKGTQLELLKKYLAEKDSSIGQKSIIMGDIFRAFFKETGFIQDIARDVSMKQGKFQPDFLTNALFIERCVRTIEKGAHIFFDGYPRSVDQLKVLKSLCEYIGIEKPHVLNVEVSADSVRERMKLRGRGDDSDSAIESRLSEYDRTIVPMLEEIKKDQFFTYIEIDGEPAPDAIHKDIIKKLGI